MTVRNVNVKRLNASTQQVEIDDAITAYVKIYHKTATLIALLKASQSDKKIVVEADKQIAKSQAQDNMHRLQKQQRAYQRSNEIRFSKNQTLTHSTLAKRKVAIKTRTINDTQVCNVLSVYHLYDAKVQLSADDFKTLATFIASLK